MCKVFPTILLSSFSHTQYDGADKSLLLSAKTVTISEINFGI
jgi:hypothetical protein